MCRTLLTVLVVVSIAAAASADTGSPDPNTDRVLRASCRIGWRARHNVRRTFRAVLRHPWLRQ